MLYVSTRSKTDSFTAYRALHEDYAPDGGMFVPFRLPCFSREEIDSLADRSFGDNIAQILNLFFSARLNGWDVDCCVGRYPVKLAAMSHRIIVAETWHNLASKYSYITKSLYNKMCGTDNREPTQWAKIAIRIALLFGLFGELLGSGITEADVALTAGDFSSPMAAWYAQRMGLPIGTIICGCNENGAVWDLIHRGEFNTNAATVSTDLPELDIARPDGLERLIYGCFGMDENLCYLDVCRKHGTYHISEDKLAVLSSGISVAVVGKARTDAIIASFYRTNDYIIDAFTALSYGALQDYRSRTGESRPTLLLAERSPLHSAGRIASAIGISENKLAAIVNTAKE